MAAWDDDAPLVQTPLHDWEETKPALPYGQWVGEQIRRARLAAGLDQQELADLSEVARTTVTSVENGRQPRPAIQRRLERTLKLNLESEHEYLIVSSVLDEVREYLLADGDVGVQQRAGYVRDHLAHLRRAGYVQDYFAHLRRAAGHDGH